MRIEWKAFLLRVEPKVGDREKFVEYTKSWLRPAEVEPRANFRVWSSAEPQPSSSLPAQVAFKVLADGWPEYADAYHHRLLEAYFSENRDISNGDVLAELGAQVGVDHDDLRSAAIERSEAMTAIVIAEHNSAIENGVTAVPTTMFDHVFPVPGAQTVETYEQVVEAILERRVQAEP